MVSQFAYCDNNPVTRVDNDGEFRNVLGGAAIGMCSQFVNDLIIFEEIFYTTVNSAVVGACSGFLFEGSTLKSLIPSAEISDLGISAQKIAGGVSLFQVFVSVTDFPQTHTWKSPNVGRWYVFK